MAEVQQHLGSEAIDVRRLWKFVWFRKAFVAGVTAFCTAAAAVYAMLATQIFRAEAIIQPRGESQGAGSLRSLTAQFGGLIDVAGLSGGLGDDRDVAVATLQSRAIIEPLIRDTGLLQEMYASDWNADKKEWKDPDGAPTVWEAYSAFREDVLSISENTRTGLVTVAVEWKDAEKARDWVNEIIVRTNAHLRAKAISEAEGNLAYLEGQARKVQQVELQQSMYKLVEAELKKLMLAQGGEEFAVKVIDAPVVPQKRIRPRRLRIVLASFFISAIFAVGVLLAWAGVRQEGA